MTQITVLGAGTMGHGIAHAALMAGYPTVMYDVAPEAVEQGRQAIAAILAKGIELGKLSRGDADAAAARLKTTASLSDALHGAGFIIEAAPEQIALKLALLADIETHAPADAIIASNTSSLSVTEMAAALSSPGRLAGMHFFNPVHKMKLVEIVRALESSDGTLKAIEDVARRMGKETVVVRDSAGFVTSRVNAMIGN